VLGRLGADAVQVNGSGVEPLGWRELGRIGLNLPLLGSTAASEQS